VGRSISGIRDFVCLYVCVRALKGKLLELSTPKWPVWRNGRAFARDPKGGGFEF